ncbi:MAG: SDR family NAD(P)-dependent oxidoreductase [Haliscomenobacter sp.]|nr:SDR family NAD(P)-dependent oxidoreductase [Haliscomenobacter sp.]MBK8656701.1 SDR family NAD(P)-dependent oxidoreductase [Haliscomenobacter sp.]
MVFTLITGASTGLGRAFAFDCAAKGMNLILAALPGENLDMLCQEITQTYGVQAVFYETDLTQEKSVEDLVSWVLGNYRVNFLINNAGIGGTRSIFHAPISLVDAMLRLNVLATSLLTCSLLPELQSHPQSYVLNVSSIIALSPVANKMVYPASKAFVYSFSRGLYQELKGTNTHVSVVLPGPIATNASVNSRIKKQGWLGRMMLLYPEEVARISLEQTLRKRSVIIPGMANKLNWLLLILFPTKFLLPFLSRRFYKEMEAPADPGAVSLSAVSHQNSNH